MATRTAVATALDDLGPGSAVLVACSGGPDSLALAAAAAWVGERANVMMTGLVIDHGLQAHSEQVAVEAAATCSALGVPASVRRVDVDGPGGPEAAAREARYRALEAVAHELDAVAVLLGHTREDQAETVLLRLARGSGARSLGAMAPRSGRWRRPFLHLDRATARAAAADVLAPLGRSAWADPHNEDDAFGRVRVRRLLADLGEELGPSVVLGLSRSADLLREDADALDAAAAEAYGVLVAHEAAGWSADCADLAELPGALRGRVIRAMALAAGCPADELDLEHVRRLRDLVERWAGQGAASLPGGVRGERVYGRLWLRPKPSLEERQNGAPGGA